MNSAGAGFAARSLPAHEARRGIGDRPPRFGGDAVAELVSDLGALAEDRGCAAAVLAHKLGGGLLGQIRVRHSRRLPWQHHRLRSSSAVASAVLLPIPYLIVDRFYRTFCLESRIVADLSRK